MAVKEVLMLGNPLLREVSDDVADFNGELVKIIKDLEDTLLFLQRSKGTGRALAAPQIGYTRKVILYKTPETKLIMVNPEIIYKSAEMFEVWDSCYSFDLAFYIKISRHVSIDVSYLDEKGKRKIYTFNDDLSELFQHEIDHLYGILATDYLNDNRQIMMKSELDKGRII
ncbi:MAG TPA: peptide deformylase [Syntrophomonadaceae bacterium]|nr:peptide deformylase [Syntrophomonadaceae bacterium]HNX28934.1 peptide deformylase [Syntrophomonadaceae bacterium]HPR93918.1 peptide deformylase [Syntrophomonadaceae bacterium]